MRQEMHQLANSTSKKESLPFNLPTIQSAAIKAKRTLAALNMIEDILKLICKIATLQNDGFASLAYFLFLILFGNAHLIDNRQISITKIWKFEMAFAIKHRTTTI